MSRPLRIEVAGGCYHVTARGVERSAIFRDDADGERFVELLGQAATRFGFVVHAWVLMGNHYHLLLRTGQANLSRAMQWLNQQYAVGFNRRHRRVGTLLQGRFHAVVLDWEESGLAVSRYVHLNPVRVRRLGGSRRQREEGVNEPESGRRLSREQAQARLLALREHRWSSWQAYRGAQRAPAWLAMEEVTEAMRSTGRRARRGDLDRRRAYVQWVEEEVWENARPRLWDGLRAGVVLGVGVFAERMLGAVRGEAKEVRRAGAAAKARPTLSSVMRAVEQVKGEKVGDFQSRWGDWGRDAIFWLGQQVAGSKLRELSQWAGGLDESSVSVAIARLRRRAQEDKKLARALARVQAALESPRNP